MRWDSATALPLVPLAREPEEPYGPGRDRHEPPELELRPYTPEELHRLFRGGAREVDEVEARLVQASRARGGRALRVGQGLRALQKGSRFMELAFRLPTMPGRSGSRGRGLMSWSPSPRRWRRGRSSARRSARGG